MDQLWAMREIERLSLLAFSAAAATAVLSDSNLAAASWRSMQAIAGHVTTQRESNQAETEASAITDIETSVMAVVPPRIAVGVIASVLRSLLLTFKGW
jgi:hypothetical protein